MKIAVIGAGSWGTALSQVLANNGHSVCLWARKLEVVDGINYYHRNIRYLSDQELSHNITASADYSQVLQNVDAVLIVTPSALLRDVATKISDTLRDQAVDLPILICSKGIEQGTGYLPIEAMCQVLGNKDRFAVLSGPNHAEEIIKGKFAASVVASNCNETAIYFRDLLASATFRTYTSNDPIGVELCAAFKNVIAICVGISYGLDLGDNTAALLITRGLAEMSRMVVACGGEALTCMGLAGTGDMIATCMSHHSRNRRFGEEYIARGRTLEDFEHDTHMVVEGALACKTVKTLSDRFQVELPLTNVVRAIVWENADVHAAAKALSDRPLTTEFYGI